MTSLTPADFRYDLPKELIARYPPEDRPSSRLLCLDAGSGDMEHRVFRELAGLLGPGDLLVFNDTRVVRARLFGRKESGGRVEALVERLLPGNEALALLRSGRPPGPGARLRFGPAGARVLERRDGFHRIRFDDGVDVPALLEAVGRVPLPPYIARPDEPLDAERYQTVYARHDGAVAAPTAGLHFDEAMLAALRARGVAAAFLTLHVGSGTFRPVRAARLDRHRMHREMMRIGPAACRAVNRCREEGGRVVAVGTTVARALESAFREGGVRPFRGETDIFIRPGHRFRAVDAMVTNFHLPESTLLMLVSAFASREAVLAAYREAVARRYRFFSYGDAMFVHGRPGGGTRRGSAILRGASQADPRTLSP